MGEIGYFSEETTKQLIVNTSDIWEDEHLEKIRENECITHLEGCKAYPHDQLKIAEDKIELSIEYCKKCQVYTFFFNRIDCGNAAIIRKNFIIDDKMDSDVMDLIFRETYPKFEKMVEEFFGELIGRIHTFTELQEWANQINAVDERGVYDISEQEKAIYDMRAGGYEDK